MTEEKKPTTKSTKKKATQPKAGTSISYTGEVEIRYQSNPSQPVAFIKKHNAGEPGLFRFLTSALMGEPGHDLYKPNRLMLYSKVEDENGDAKVTELLINPAPYYASPLRLSLGKGVVGEKVRLTFNVSSGEIRDVGSTCNYMELWNDAPSSEDSEESFKKCASVDLSSGNEFSLVGGANLIIYWTLTFQNQTTQSES